MTKTELQKMYGKLKAEFDELNNHLDDLSCDRIEKDLEIGGLKSRNDVLTKYVDYLEAIIGVEAMRLISAKLVAHDFSKVTSNDGFDGFFASREIERYKARIKNSPNLTDLGQLNLTRDERIDLLRLCRLI